MNIHTHKKTTLLIYLYKVNPFFVCYIFQYNTHLYSKDKNQVCFMFCVSYQMSILNISGKNKTLIYERTIIIFIAVPPWVMFTDLSGMYILECNISFLLTYILCRNLHSRPNLTMLRYARSPWFKLILYFSHFILCLTYNNYYPIF